jgi:glycogen phosphorylase
MGEDNMFVFGLRADAVAHLKAQGHDARQQVEQNPALRDVVEAIRSGVFSPGEPERYRGLIDGLLNRDTYLLTADFADYVAAQGRVDALYREPAAWAARALLNIAAMGAFSSDRTVREYLAKIWTAPAH